MIDWAKSILVICLTATFVAVSGVLPHHHHNNSKICFDLSHCDSHNEPIDDHGHQQDESCPLDKHLVATQSNDHSHNKCAFSSCRDHFHFHTPILTLFFIQSTPPNFALPDPIDLGRTKERSIIVASYCQLSASLRAPPIA